MAELTVQEIKDMMAETAKAQKEAERRGKEIDRRMEESRLESQRREKEAERRGKEIDRQMKETDRQMKETDRQMKETDRQMKETDRQMKETDRRMQETDRQMQETDRRMEESRLESRLESRRREKETDRRLKKLDELFTSQWGKLIESLVEGDLVKLLKMRGITVDKTLVRREYIEVPGKPLAEFDLIACNGNETVVIEVKTTLRVEDVDHFLKSMKLFRTAMPRFQNDIIYGGVAYINVVGSADKYAQKKKLFAIKATGSSASIINAEDFEPQTF